MVAGYLGSLGPMPRIPRRPVLIFAIVHCAATFAFSLWSIGWQMLLLDTIGSSAAISWGLYLVLTLQFLLSLPLLWPMSELALHLGFSDPINDKVFWLMPFINSAVVAFGFGVALAWGRQRRSLNHGHVA